MTATRWTPKDRRGRVAGLVLALVCAFGVVPDAAAQTFRIDAIEVEGVQRIEAATVISYMTVEAGTEATATEINASLRALNATGLFADVVIEPVGATLVVRVVERPFVNRVSFEGNSVVPDEVLSGAVRTRSRTVFAVAVVEDDARRIVDAYGRSGRLNATVVPQVVERDGNRVDVVFEINEGPVTRVRKIEFLGNRAFSDSTLLDVIATKRAAWFRIFASTDQYDPGRIAGDEEALERFYRGAGYVDFRLVSVVSSLNETGSGFVITFTLDEGERFTIGKVSVVSEIAEVTAAPFAELIKLEEGDPFDGIAVERTAEAMQKRLEEGDIPFTEMRPEIVRRDEASIADVIFRIVSGDGRYVERIDIEGNVRTLDSVIRREFTFVEGDALNRTKIARSRRNLRALGYFRSVELEVLPGSQADRVMVRVTVQEQSTGSLSFGIGYSSSSKLGLNISLTERNLLGQGNRIRISYETNDTRDTYRLGYTKPYFMDRDLEAGFTLYQSDEDDESTNYTLERTGFTPTVRFALARQTEVAMRYRIESTLLQGGTDNVSPLLGGTDDKKLLSSLGYEMVWDSRDDPLDPRAGAVVSVEQEYAGVGGDSKFVTLEGYGRFFLPLDRDEKIIGSVALRLGAIQGYGSYEPEQADRFFVGGTRFRGFEGGGIGPRDLVTDEALGGKFYAVASLDILSYTLLPEELGITTSAYVDVGTLFGLDQTSYEMVGTGGVRETVTVDDGANLRASVGVEMQWRSPLGPMRFIFARAVVSEDYDDTENFRFTVGTAF